MLWVLVPDLSCPALPRGWTTSPVLLCLAPLPASCLRCASLPCLVLTIFWTPPCSRHIFEERGRVLGTGPKLEGHRKMMGNVSAYHLAKKGLSPKFLVLPGPSASWCMPGDVGVIVPPWLWAILELKCLFPTPSLVYIFQTLVKINIFLYSQKKELANNLNKVILACILSTGGKNRSSMPVYIVKCCLKTNKSTIWRMFSE